MGKNYNQTKSPLNSATVYMIKWTDNTSLLLLFLYSGLIQHPTSQLVAVAGPKHFFCNTNTGSCGVMYTPAVKCTALKKTLLYSVNNQCYILFTKSNNMK